MFIICGCNTNSSMTGKYIYEKLPTITSDTVEISECKEVNDVNAVGYEKGVSAPFTGVLDHYLIVAGGANFPQTPLTEGGKKKVYAQIWGLPLEKQEQTSIHTSQDSETTRTWRQLGTLPDSLAYGMSFNSNGRLIFAGGNINGKTSDKVYEVLLNKLESKTEATLEERPSLPVPVEQAGAAVFGERLYVVGGQSDGKALKTVFSINEKGQNWEQIAELPCTLVQPVCFADEENLYVWGGLDAENANPLSNGWKYNLQTKTWIEIAPVPDGGTFVGASGICLNSSDSSNIFIVLGGVNKALFTEALRMDKTAFKGYLSMPEEDYNFRKTIFSYDSRQNKWNEVLESSDFALAGSGICADGQDIYVIGGERKPGVRTPAMWHIKRENN